MSSDADDDVAVGGRGDNGWDEMQAAAQFFLDTTTMYYSICTPTLLPSSGSNKRMVDHRTLPRGKRTKYDHARALHCILQDYLGPSPIFNDKQFKVMFRVSRPRVQQMLEDFGNSSIEFYQTNETGQGIRGSSLEAKLLLPLKTLAYGVPPHTFRDYFQMSKTQARTACYQFDVAMERLYQREYFCLPTKEDVKNIVKLHKHQHQVDGLFGSIDCMHTVWKNCPKAWQGSFKGQKGVPTIVLEALCDHHMWFWHGAYGYAGTLNDLNIWDMSPLLDSFVVGTFADIEKEAVPYSIGTAEFDKLFILTDGAYPRLSRFAKPIKHPMSYDEKKYSAWQEACRKDIERAFGILQQKFQFVARPIYLIELKLIGLVSIPVCYYTTCVWLTG